MSAVVGRWLQPAAAAAAAAAQTRTLLVVVGGVAEGPLPPRHIQLQGSDHPTPPKSLVQLLLVRPRREHNTAALELLLHQLLQSQLLA